MKSVLKLVRYVTSTVADYIQETSPFRYASVEMPADFRTK